MSSVQTRPVVIDPGTQDAAHLERIMDVAGGAIDRVVCTHSHPDHSPGAAELRARTGAPCIGLPAPRDPYQDPSYAPDAVLRDGESVSHPEFRLRVVLTPGHVSNHACLLLEDEGLLFTGDHLMQGTTVVIIPPEGSMRDYLASLRRLQHMPVTSLAPGSWRRDPRRPGRDLPRDRPSPRARGQGRGGAVGAQSRDDR